MSARRRSSTRSTRSTRGNPSPTYPMPPQSSNLAIHEEAESDSEGITFEPHPSDLASPLGASAESSEWRTRTRSLSQAQLRNELVVRRLSRTQEATEKNIRLIAIGVAAISVLVLLIGAGTAWALRGERSLATRGAEAYYETKQRAKDGIQSAWNRADGTSAYVKGKAKHADDHFQEATDEAQKVAHKVNEEVKANAKTAEKLYADKLEKGTRFAHEKAEVLQDHAEQQARSDRMQGRWWNWGRG